MMASTLTASEALAIFLLATTVSACLFGTYCLVAATKAERRNKLLMRMLNKQSRIIRDLTFRCKNTAMLLERQLQEQKSRGE